MSRPRGGAGAFALAAWFGLLSSDSWGETRADCKVLTPAESSALERCIANRAGCMAYWPSYESDWGNCKSTQSWLQWAMNAPPAVQTQIFGADKARHSDVPALQPKLPLPVSAADSGLPAWKNLPRRSDTAPPKPAAELATDTRDPYGGASDAISSGAARSAGVTAWTAGVLSVADSAIGPGSGTGAPSIFAQGSDGFATGGGSLCRAALPDWARQCQSRCDAWVKDKRENSYLSPDKLDLGMAGDLVGVMLSKRKILSDLYEYEHRGRASSDEADTFLIKNYRANGAQQSGPGASDSTRAENDFVHFCLNTAIADEFDRSRSPVLAMSPLVERVRSCPGYDKDRDGRELFRGVTHTNAGSTGYSGGSLDPFLSCVKRAGPYR